MAESSSLPQDVESWRCWLRGWCYWWKVSGWNLGWCRDPGAPRTEATAMMLARRDPPNPTPLYLDPWGFLMLHLGRQAAGWEPRERSQQGSGR